MQKELAPHLLFSRLPSFTSYRVWDQTLDLWLIQLPHSINSRAEFCHPLTVSLLWAADQAINENFGVANLNQSPLLQSTSRLETRINSQVWPESKCIPQITFSSSLISNICTEHNFVNLTHHIWIYLSILDNGDAVYCFWTMKRKE